LLKVCLACFDTYVFTRAEFRQGMGLMGAEGGKEMRAASSFLHEAACNILMQDTGDKRLVWQPFFEGFLLDTLQVFR